MNDELDDRIRTGLRGLREASVPPVPALRAVAPSSRLSLGLLAAAGMLLALVASLISFHRHPTPGGALAARITALEERITRVEHEELRILLGKELALLRRELELARSADP